VHPSPIQRLIFPALPILFVASTTVALAAGQVQLELVTDQGVSITAQQQWLRQLAEAGVSGFRIRVRQPSDQPKIETGGTPQAPIYQVTGVIVSDNEVVVPGKRFRLNNLVPLRQWLDELAQQGPAENRAPTDSFGLELEQFQRLHDDLAQPLGFSTAGMGRLAVLEKIAGQLKHPLRIDRQRLGATDEDKVSEELSKVSCGTALAGVLRPLGFCLVLHRGAGQGEYAVMASAPDLKAWPVGWKPDKPDRELVPGLYEFLNVNVQGVAVTKVVEAVGTRLELPVLWDQNALARHGVEPEQAIVNLPNSRTTYSLMLRKVLFQAKLKSELRIDEAGQPLLWITTIKPL